MVQGVPSVDRGNWEREGNIIALRKGRIIQNAVSREESFGKNHALYVDPACKDVDHFRNWSVHELSCLKACKQSQVSKVYPRLVLARYQLSPVRVRTTKILTKSYDY